MCLDNAEALIEKTNRDLKILLSKLLQEVPNLSIILTTRPDVGFLSLEGVQSFLYKVENLSRLESVHLFIKMSESEITNTEIVELIEETPDFQYSHLCIEKGQLLPFL